MSAAPGIAGALAALGGVVTTILVAARHFARATRPRQQHRPAPPVTRATPPTERTNPVAIDPARAATLAGLDSLVRALHTGTITPTQYEAGIAALLPTLPGAVSTTADPALLRQAIRESGNRDLRVAKPAVDYLIGRTTAHAYTVARIASGASVEPEDAVPPGYTPRDRSGQ
jgi:hypothetical protein